MDYNKVALMFKAFCDENRLKIIELLAEGEKCGCTILEELEIGQSTLSHHMKILVDSTIVESKKVGKWKHYSLSDSGSKAVKEILEGLLHKAEDYQVDNVCDEETVV